MTRFLPLAAAFGLLCLTADATPQPPSSKPSSKTPAAKPKPRLEAIAETKLLMDALLQVNHKGLARNLGQAKPDDAAWVFSRGQALLLAESGNLLMMRPPKSGGSDDWMELATELRERGTKLAKAAADKDAGRAQQAFLDVTATCNRCHQTFRVPVRVPGFEAKEP